MSTPLPPPPAATTAESHALLYADDSLLVVAKPTRLLSVPGRGEDKQDCLIARVQQDYPDALIVHRLDFDTSGLVVLARGKAMHRRLSIAFQEREVDKRYVAVVDGKLMASDGEVNLPLLVDWPNRPLHKVDFDQGKPSLTLLRALIAQAPLLAAADGHDVLIQLHHVRLQVWVGDEVDLFRQHLPFPRCVQDRDAVGLFVFAYFTF